MFLFIFPSFFAALDGRSQAVCGCWTIIVPPISTIYIAIYTITFLSLVEQIAQLGETILDL